MVERVCPNCKIPMNVDKCVKTSCQTKTIMSTTLYWCDDCNIPVFEPMCPRCGTVGKYIATDVRPVFPEERVLLALIQGKRHPHCYDTASVWYGSGAYFINGKKEKISTTEINKWSLEKIKSIKEVYDELVNNIFNPKITTLFSYELPDKNSVQTGEYISFLDLQYNDDLAYVKDTFRWSNAYLWLLNVLKENDGCMYFGAISEKLHNSLVSDPKPYRKDVKQLLANLLSMIKILNMDEIVIDRPNYSQRVRLKEIC